MTIFKTFLAPNSSPPTSLSSQLNRCQPGAAVFYRLASNTNAHKVFLDRLQASKASLVFVCGHIITTDQRVVCLAQNDFENLLTSALEQYYPVPDKRFYAVTGTNGKTSTVYLLTQILLHNSRRVLSIGTLGTKIDGVTVFDDGLTTPGLCELRRTLYEMQHRYDDVVMEVSSHALEQKRIAGIIYDVAGWTNLTQDHLDYHITMEAYFQAKLLLRQQVRDNSLFVADHELCEKIKALGVPVRHAGALTHPELTPALKTPFAADNLGLAVKMAAHMGVTDVDWKKLEAAPGRFQLLEHRQVRVIVDYAHTPDALENACRGVKLTYPDATLTVVFGCGGDRDKTKRPLMGTVAAKHADRIIVTSDNPRGEETFAIMADIIAGIDREYTAEADRKKAIEGALESAIPGEVILIAGKGHENYQEIKGVRSPFDDADVVQEFWKRV